MFNFDKYQTESIEFVYDSDGIEFCAVCAQVRVWDKPDYCQPLTNERLVWVCVDDNQSSAWREDPLSKFDNKNMSYWFEINQVHEQNICHSKLIDYACFYPTDNLFDSDCDLGRDCFYPIWIKLYQVLHQPGFDWAGYR